MERVGIGVLARRASEYEDIQRKLAEQDMNRPDPGNVVLTGVTAGERAGQGVLEVPVKYIETSQRWNHLFGKAHIFVPPAPVGTGWSVAVLTSPAEGSLFVTMDKVRPKVELHGTPHVLYVGNQRVRDNFPEGEEKRLKWMVFDDARNNQPRLVPVRKGGPWGGREKPWRHWSYWRNGKIQGALGSGRDKDTYQVHDGEVEYIWNGKSHPCGTTNLKGLEFRAPKDYTGPLPEGCCWATDFVVGQRVRGKMSGTCGVVCEVMEQELVKVDLSSGGKARWNFDKVEGY